MWRKFRKYRGPLIKGTSDFAPPPGEHRDSHIHRAFWLTCKVETGAKFGMVQAYDGCGMTAGLDQHIAMYPSMLAHDNAVIDSQGTLWKLLRRLESVNFISGGGVLEDPREPLWLALADRGWYLAQDGILRWFEHGEAVKGRAIRETFTPHDGNVQTVDQRKQAAGWALLFHDVFNCPQLFRAQVEYGLEHLVKRSKRRREGYPYPKDITAVCTGTDISLSVDLALCMYHANSVNAPAIANRALRLSFTKRSDRDFAKALIYTLGNSTYGRWDDDIKGGRYQRLRTAAKNSGLWPKGLFVGEYAIMPKDLPG